MTRVALTIPQPPSVNGMWRAVGGRTILSKRGREFRTAGLQMLSFQPLPAFTAGERLRVMLDLHPRDKRRIDIDNYSKGSCDLLTHAGVWGDDSQIDELIIRRRPPVKGGRVDVFIEVLA